MELSLPVLVASDERERWEILIPGLSTRSFVGPSLAALMDDVALHLMEVLPKETTERLHLYESCPHVELRRVVADTRLAGARAKELTPWKGRISVVLTRWTEDQFYVATAPRLGTARFAIRDLGALPETLTALILERLAESPTLDLESLVCRGKEHLEILAFDADYPSILPSQPRLPRRRKKKKRTPGDRADTKPKAKRVLISPAELRSVATNLTHRALDGRLGQAHLRGELATELTRQLDHEGTGILLVGPSGAGKTALVHDVVRRLAAAGESISHRRDVWQVDGNRLISGMSVVGAWEHRLAAIVFELSLRQDVLYVPDLPALVYTGRSSHSDRNVAEYLEPHLGRGDLRIIGECTPERLLATRDEAPGFFARFRVIPVEPLSERDALLVLAHTARDLGEQEALAVEPEALEAILALTRRFRASAVHPGKSVGLLQRTLQDHSRVEVDGLGRRVVGREAVVETFAREAGLPRFVLWERGSRPHVELREFFSRRIIAQPAAVEAATDVVNLLEQGLNDPARPISTFLFVGPTGVGKTETAKALAELLFGGPERMVRIDMSEMLYPDSVARLFGDRLRPDGELTRRIEQQPFSVILLDEVEKAHPSVFDALLQVLGEGRMTNAAGRTVDFTSTVIIMTSNLGVKGAESRLGFDNDGKLAVIEHYRSAAERYFRPEFFNRIDRVVAFSPLGRDAITPIVARLLEQMLSRRGLRRSSIVVDVDPKLVDLVVDRGFDPRYGARSIKRIMEQQLAVPLAQHLAGRAGTELTIAELYPSGERMGLAVQRPSLAGRPPLPPLPPLLDWRSAEERFSTLERVFDELADSDLVDALRHERTASLGADARGSDRPVVVGAILDELADIEEPDGQTTLARRINDFRSTHLEQETFEESLVRDDSALAASEKYTYTKTRVAPEARPLRTERPPLSQAAARALETLELDLAALAYRARAAFEPESRPVLLRFLPVARAPEGRSFAATLARAFVACWGQRWSTATPYARSADGRWSEWAGLGRHPPTGEAASTTDPSTGAPAPSPLETAFAVELRGPGISALIEPELGLHLALTEVGPDLLTALVRVEDVGDGGDPVARLAALDEALFEHLEARRRGGGGADPRPPLPLIRTFENGRARDPDTGLELELDTLDAGLYRVGMRRIFAQTMGAAAGQLEVGP